MNELEARAIAAAWFSVPPDDVVVTYALDDEYLAPTRRQRLRRSLRRWPWSL